MGKAAEQKPLCMSPKKKDIVVDDFSELHQAVSKLGDGVIVYRGERDVEWLLRPKVGRLDFKGGDVLKEEETILRLFKESSVPYIDYPLNSNWEWLAIAQHHTAPTRLLDWTRNLLVAAYFAVEEEHGEDSVIYVLTDNKFINLDKNPNPHSHATVGRFLPRHITPRITAQAGIFTIHPDPTADFKTSNKVRRIIIRRKARRDLKWDLYKYGVHRASLFPGLDGLSRHIQWLRSAEY